MTIFENGKLKPGIYKIQNIYSDTYLDIEVCSRKACCRPERDLGQGRGLWEIKQFGAGYTVQRVDPGMPEQFCTPWDRVTSGGTICVTAYPIVWRIEIVDDERHRAFEYVRFYWVTNDLVWDLAAEDRSKDGAPVQLWNGLPESFWQIWRLVPVTVEGAPMTPITLRPLPEAGMPGHLPSIEEEPDRPPVRAQNTVYECDELGTVVNEVTVVTTTTRRRYRVEAT